MYGSTWPEFGSQHPYKNPDAPIPTPIIQNCGDREGSWLSVQLQIHGEALSQKNKANSDVAGYPASSSGHYMCTQSSCAKKHESFSNIECHIKLCQS